MVRLNLLASGIVPKIAYWNIWEQSRNFVIKENKSENAFLMCKCHLLINKSHQAIFVIWYTRVYQYLLLFPYPRLRLSRNWSSFSTLHKKMTFSIKDFFMRIWSHLLKKSLIENFSLCAVPRFCTCMQCHNSLYQETIVCFLTRFSFPDNLS